MKWKTRVALFLFGIFCIYVDYFRFVSGKIFFGTNYKVQPIWIGAAMSMGIVFCCMALLPSGNWVYQHITTKRKRNQHAASFGRKS